jgi:signal transduction histidine kinase
VKLQDKYKVFDEMIEGVQLISSDYRYLYVNDAVSKHARLNADQLVGYKMVEKFPGIDQTPMFALIRECMEEDKNQKLLNEFTFPDGSIGYFELRMQRIEEGVLIMSFDVTDLKKAEELIKNTNVELERLIQIRTKELQEQTQIAKASSARLAKMNENKDKFFSIVAHDLKGPLINLKEFTRLLKEGMEDIEPILIKSLAEKMYFSIDKTIQLADNIITWAKLQMQEFNVCPEPLSIKEELKIVIEYLSESILIKEIIVEIQDNTSRKFNLDRQQLHFVIRNLLMNAIKFSPRKAKVQIILHQDGDTLLVDIKDRGIGMDAESLAKINSKEKVPSKDGTSGEKGTGLGLKLTREFVEVNNGTLSIQSELNKGTTVSISLLSHPEY